MLISRTPLRFSIIGGGSDMFEYIDNYGPCKIISMTLEASMYVTYTARQLYSGVARAVYRSNIRQSYTATEQVDSIDDLLRLREKREITTFREVLDNWKEAILNREKNVEKRIRSDIAKANAQLKKLEKWRSVDRWLYYVTLPTAFVPYVSGAVSIASFALRTHIEKAERLHSWVCIGR